MRKLLFTTIIIAFFAVSTRSAETQLRPTTPEIIQSAFISNFINFIENPNFQSDSINICLNSQSSKIAADSFSDTKAKRKITVIEFDKTPIEQACDILVSSTALNHEFKNPPLIITNQESNCNKNTHIRFFILDNKVRFAINLEATKRDGFQFSSKLLALAKIENCS